MDILDTTDPDFERYYRRCGIIVATVEDEARGLTGDNGDDLLYCVGFDDRGEGL